MTVCRGDPLGRPQYRTTIQTAYVDETCLSQPNSNSFYKQVIVCPTRGIIQNVRSNVIERGLIANDVFVIVALPDGRGRRDSKCPALLGQCGLKLSYRRTERSGRQSCRARCSNHFASSAFSAAMMSVNANNPVQVIWHNYKSVKDSIGTQDGNSKPQFLNERSQFG